MPERSYGLNAPRDLEPIKIGMPPQKKEGMDMTSDRLRDSRLRFEQALVQRTNRRRLLALGSAATLGAAVSLPGSPSRIFAQDAMGTPIPSPEMGSGSPTVAQAPKFAATPFSLGVASGDPTPDGVVLWTRLAVSPLDGGGMDAIPYEVRWELATDENFG